MKYHFKYSYFINISLLWYLLSFIYMTTAFTMTSSLPPIKLPHSPRDLLVVGGGELGSLITRQLSLRYPHYRVICETATNDKHNQLSKILPNNVVLRLRSLRNLNTNPEAIVICIPPSVNGYLEEVQSACDLVRTTTETPQNRLSSVLLISSIGVYGSKGKLRL